MYKKPIMNVWKFGWCPMTYPSNWLSNFKNIIKCIKYSLQRIVNGYCDRDVWNLDSYYLDLFYLTLNTLADKGCSYPYDMEPEEWQKYLKFTAKCFYRANESNNFYMNEYWDKYKGYVKEQDIAPNKIEDDFEAKRLSQLSLNKDKDLSYTRDYDLNLGMQNLRARFHDLWD